MGLCGSRRGHDCSRSTKISLPHEEQKLRLWINFEEVTLILGVELGRLLCPGLCLYSGTVRNLLDLGMTR